MKPKNVQNFLPEDLEGKARVAIFLSGSGTNAEKILEKWHSLGEDAPLEVVCLVTDRPKGSRCQELADKFDLPMIALPLKSFYQEHNLDTCSLATEEGRRVRELWTVKLWALLEPYKCHFGIFAGFVPLCNITEKLTCLNVHPGDLTYLNAKGERVLVGLHTVPVELAILEGLDYMRSSVIVASAYGDSGEGMDEGVIIGISSSVAVEMKGKSVDEWQAVYDARESASAKDEFKIMAEENQEILKVNGDWIVFPEAVFDFARGVFALDEAGELLVRHGQGYLPALCLEYSEGGKEIFMRELK